MQVPIIQVDAFAAAPFGGNPAAVVPLTAPRPDEWMQAVAAEMNLSETAFLVADLPAGVTAPDPHYPAYHLRWFTPAIEVDLCGHATLATASYLFEDAHPQAQLVQFHTRSGWLIVRRDPGGGYTMDFPSEPPVPTQIDPVVAAALGAPVREALEATDLVYVLADAETVRTLTPDHTVLAGLPVRGVIVTAPGADTGYDFVSRYFGARAGVSEDPVTGSAHSQIASYWATRLGRTTLVARQLSTRGGTVHALVTGNRTLLTGTCTRFLTGTATIPD